MFLIHGGYYVGLKAHGKHSCPQGFCFFGFFVGGQAEWLIGHILFYNALFLLGFNKCVIIKHCGSGLDFSAVQGLF